MSGDIEKTELKKFGLEKKGYNKSEVNDYIQSLHEKYRILETKIALVEQQFEETERKLREYQEIDGEIRDALIYLKESERKAIDKTKEEVSRLLKEAEDKSQKIIDEAENEAKSTRNTLLFLKEQHEILLTRLKIIVDSQEGMLIDFNKGSDTAHLQKSMAEAAAYRTQTEINIDSIMEKLL
jgi:cell division initiation protein